MGPSVQGKMHSNSLEGLLKYLLSLGFLLQVLISKERICQEWKCHHLSQWGRKSCVFPNNIIKSHLFTNWAADFWRIAIWHACNYLQITGIISNNPKGWFSSLFLMHHGKYFGHQEWRDMEKYNLHINRYCTWFGDRGQGQLRFPHLTASVSTLRRTSEVSEPPESHQAHMPLTTNGPHSHQPQTSAWCQVNNTGCSRKVF